MNTETEKSSNRPDICRMQCCRIGGICVRPVCCGAMEINEKVGEVHGLAVQLGKSVDTPLKRAVDAAMDLCAMIGKLSDDDAVKAIEVMKSGLRVQLLALDQREAS